MSGSRQHQAPLVQIATPGAAAVKEHASAELVSGD